MDVEQAKCILEFRYADECRQVKKPCQKSKPGSNRIQWIINGDNLNAELQRQADENPDLVIYYHRNCVSRCVTPLNFLKITYDPGDCEEPGNTKRVHCFDTPKFEFKEHCLYCSQICNVKKKSKAPTPMEVSLNVWTSISLFGMYLEYDGNSIVSRSNLLNDILNSVNDLVILTAQIVLFRDNAVATLRMTKYDDDEVDLEIALRKVAKTVSKELSEFQYSRHANKRRLSKSIARVAVSETLLKLL